MLYTFCDIPSNCCYRKSSHKSFIRILHSSPGTPAVDVYANGKLLANNLSYRGFTPYAAVDPGNYNIRVYLAGKTINPVIDTNLTIAPHRIFTVAAAGSFPNISLLPVLDPVLPKDPEKAYVRFAHLSPNAPTVDITLPDGKKLFSEVQFKEITAYIPVNQGNYTFETRVSGKNQVALTVPNIKLKPNRFYTVYAVGLVGGQPPLQVLITLDGNSYL